MSFDAELALERVLSEGDEWQSWRALRLTGEAPGAPPVPAHQDQEGAFTGPSGRTSPGATGAGLCHLAVLGLGGSAPAVVAADWLEGARTPAKAWLDAPDDMPGGRDTGGRATQGGSRVWATAAACSGLLAVGRDPGSRAFDLLRGEADVQGRFTGGAYPTFAAAAAFWLAEGARTEMAEWALRWAREVDGEEAGWGPSERSAALIFWAAARLPSEHPSVEIFLDDLFAGGAQLCSDSPGGPCDLELSLRALELLAYFDE